MQDIPKRCGVMYEVVTGIPAFSNFYHENLNKRTSTPIKDSNMIEDNSNEHSTFQNNSSENNSREDHDFEVLEKFDNNYSNSNDNGLSELDDSIDPL